eukprot:6741922-Pyramimonas_sp.AAC.1
MGDTAPEWVSAFVTGQFATLTKTVTDTSSQLTGQIKQLDGRMAALDIKVQQVEIRIQAPEEAMKTASVTASSTLGTDRTKLARVGMTAGTDTSDSCRMWASGYPRAVLSTARQTTWQQFQQGAPSHLMDGTTA